MALDRKASRDLPRSQRVLNLPSPGGPPLGGVDKQVEACYDRRKPAGPGHKGLDHFCGDCYEYSKGRNHR